SSGDLNIGTAVVHDLDLAILHGDFHAVPRGSLNRSCEIVEARVPARGNVLAADHEIASVDVDAIEQAARRAGRLHRDLADRRNPHARVELDADRLADVRADLERRTAERAVQNLTAVEVRLARDAIDLGQALLHFLIERRAVAVAVRGVSRLHSELTDPLQVVRHLLQSAFRRLRERNAVVRIAHGLVETANLRGHTLGDRQSRRVVLRAVDTQTRGQAL